MHQIRKLLRHIKWWFKPPIILTYQPLRFTVEATDALRHIPAQVFIEPRGRKCGWIINREWIDAPLEERTIQGRAVIVWRHDGQIFQEVEIDMQSELQDRSHKPPDFTQL